MAIDIGLDHPGAFERLASSMKGFAQADAVAQNFPRNVVDLSAPGSAIARIMAEIPDPPVDPRLTISYGITSSTGPIRQVFSLMMNSNSEGTTPIVLQSLTRTALLGAARIVYMLGPEDHHQRLSNTIDILTVEGKSLMRAYKTFSSFTELAALVPPEEIVTKQAQRLDEIGNRGRLGEQEILNRTASIIAHIITAKEVETAGTDRETNETVLREMYQWLFNTLSGVAHGFAWPKLVPGNEYMSGDFVSDFCATVDLVGLAVDLVDQRRKRD